MATPKKKRYRGRQLGWSACLTYRLLSRHQPVFKFLVRPSQQYSQQYMFVLHGRLLLANQWSKVEARNGGGACAATLSCLSPASLVPSTPASLPILQGIASYWRTAQGTPVLTLTPSTLTAAAVPATFQASAAAVEYPAGAPATPWANITVVGLYGFVRASLKGWLASTAARPLSAQLVGFLDQLRLSYIYHWRIYWTMRSVNADGWPWCWFSTLRPGQSRYVRMPAYRHKLGAYVRRYWRTAATPAYARYPLARPWGHVARGEPFTRGAFTWYLGFQLCVSDSRPTHPLMSQTAAVPLRAYHTLGAYLRRGVEWCNRRAPTLEPWAERSGASMILETTRYPAWNWAPAGLDVELRQPQVRKQAPAPHLLWQTVWLADVRVLETHALRLNATLVPNATTPPLRRTVAFPLPAFTYKVYGTLGVWGWLIRATYAFGRRQARHFLYAISTPNSRLAFARRWGQEGAWPERRRQRLHNGVTYSRSAAALRKLKLRAEGIN